MARPSKVAKLIAGLCEDAYSFDAYGEKEWAKTVQFLIDNGFSDPADIEAIMRSKHTRWARDHASGYEGSAKIFAAYFQDCQREFTPAKVAELRL
jgi:hypothetical protein